MAAAFDAGALGGGFSRLPAADLLQRAQVAEVASLVEGTDLRLWTHRHGSDGFYAAAWERRS